MEIEEFYLLWFESIQEWKVIFPTGEILSDNWGAVGYAFNAALRRLNRSEAEFECEEDSGTYQLWVKDEVWWIE